VPGDFLQAFLGVLSHGLICFYLLYSLQTNALNQSFSVLDNVASKELITMFTTFLAVVLYESKVWRTSNTPIM
jgi:hypothetical protein